MRFAKAYLPYIGAMIACVVITVLAVNFSQPKLDDFTVNVWNIKLESAQYQEKLNINTANRDELMYVEGIGAALADRIYAYLASHRPIASLKELKNVDGVGDKRIEALEKIFYAG